LPSASPAQVVKLSAYVNLLEGMMADVYAVTFTLIGILLSVPALLIALNLLFPRTTGVAYERLKYTPVRSFILGLVVLLAFLFWIVVTAQAGQSLVQATAVLAAAAGMGVGSLGGAGMARLLAEKLGDIAAPASHLTHLLRGALLFEFACLVPLVGWFVFLPLAGTAALGAAVFGLIGRSPRTESEAEPAPATEQPTPTG
jgi:hypothetical protein